LHGEGGAQDLVPAHDLRERAREGERVERAGEAQGERDDVGRAVGLELIEGPEALLRERERQIAVARRARERWERREREPPALLQGGLDHGGEAARRRVLEERAQRQLDAEGVADAGDDLRGEERV